MVLKYAKLIYNFSLANERTKFRNTRSLTNRYFQAFPLANVQWSRTREQEKINMDRARVGLRGQGKHVLILDNPMKVL